MALGCTGTKVIAWDTLSMEQEKFDTASSTVMIYTLALKRKVHITIYCCCVLPLLIRSTPMQNCKCNAGQVASYLGDS